MTASSNPAAASKTPVTAQPESAASSDSASAREVAAVVATVARLADGNCATKADIKLIKGNAQMRAVRMGMKVGIGWGSTDRALTGNRAVQGSQPCRAFEDVQHHLDQVCSTACRDPAMAKRVADQIALSPVTALGSFQDGYQIGPLPHAAHLVETCDRCGGNGRVRCTHFGCSNGQVDCTACGRTGKAICSRCQGSGSDMQHGQYFGCRQCHGSGRYGNCRMCLGAAYTTCGVCHGTAKVGCRSCAETGCFTQIYSSHLVGRVSRTMAFDADAPDGFKLSCKAVSPMTALAQTTGSLARAEVSSIGGEASVVLHCQVRHVEADIACGLERIHIDALGPDPVIPLMPPFLDGLTAELVDDIRVASASSPAQALSLATKARLTRDILTAVGRGSRPNAAAVVNRWLGAVSDVHAELVDGSIRKAYGRAARSSVRRTWLLLSPLLLVGAVLSNAYQVPAHLLHRFMPFPGEPSMPMAAVSIAAAETAAVLPLVLLVWLVAGRVGRRRLRAGVGKLARSSPRQGAWPWLGLLVALAAGMGGASLRLDAAPMGLPWASAARPGGRSLGQAFTAMTAGESAAAPVLSPPVASRPAPTTAERGQPQHRP